MGQRSGFDLIQEIHQKLSRTNTTQRISWFGAGVNTAVRKMPDLPHRRCSSERDVPESQVTVLNFLQDVRALLLSTRTRPSCQHHLQMIGVLWQEESRAPEPDGEHAISASCTAVCQARTEDTIFENVPRYSSASMGTTEVTNRVVEGQIRTIR